MADIKEMVITSAISIVVGTLAGFASATWTLKSDIGGVSERVAAIETESRTVWTPGAKRSEANKKEVDRIDDLVKEMQLSDEAARLLRSQLSKYEEDLRNDTLKELRNLLTK